MQVNTISKYIWQPHNNTNSILPLGGAELVNLTASIYVHPVTQHLSFTTKTDSKPIYKLRTKTFPVKLLSTLRKENFLSYLQTSKNVRTIFNETF